MQSKPSATNATLSYNGPTDGSWDYGDVSFGRSTPIRSGFAGPRDEYTFTITKPPALTTRDGGQTVTMTSVFKVKRIHDSGSGERISESDKVFFNPGNLSYLRHNETYGVNPDFSCKNELLRKGESTSCTVSFTAPADEIQNSFWEVNGLRVGTWPSQTTD